MFNPLKKMLLLSSFILVVYPQLANASPEISFNFGKKFQLGGAFKGGYDLLYRITINEGSSTALGLRLNTLQRFNKILPDRTHILFTILTNYRLHVTESFFTGLIAGIDILKTYSIYETVELNKDVNLLGALTTNEYLWDRFSADLALELGYQATSGFLMKLEIGYDLLSFNCIGDVTANLRGVTTDLSEDDEDCITKFNGIYTTVGVGYHF